MHHVRNYDWFASAEAFAHLFRNDVRTLATPSSLHQMKVAASIKRRVDAYIEETKIAMLGQIGLNSIKVP
jgi:hypothetical protein